MENKKNFDQILEEAIDFKGLSAEEKITVTKNIKDIVMENAIVRVIDESTDEQAEAFTAFLEEMHSPQEIVDYLGAQIPSFYPIVFEEVSLLQNK